MVDRLTRQLLRHEARLRKRDERARKKAERQQKRAERRRNRKPSVLLQEFWNLPNMLTVGRILVVPLFVWLLSGGSPMDSFWAAFVFTLAAVTDVIDGFLARRWNLITVTGKLLDPLADKLIVAAALVMMVHLGRVPAWLVIVLLSREFIVNGLRQIAASEGMVIAAGQEGKWKTSMQLVGIVALCVNYRYPTYFLFGWYDVTYAVVGRYLLYLSTAFSVWSAANYFRAFLTMLERKPNAPATAG
jgi:CDP-diacylglycerol---glycerol-3-phosphate 3-phosphatidyltransferase